VFPQAVLGFAFREEREKKPKKLIHWNKKMGILRKIL